jgi:alkylhydroperoxidase/carboxymuconolactone decarboxylase family protein YurZ
LFLKSATTIRKEIDMAMPKRFKKFTVDYPKVAKAYEALGDAVHTAGSLDPKTRALIKLGISIGARLEGAVHSHVRKALNTGVNEDELRHAALLSLPTIGLPSMMAGLSWIDDVVNETPKKRWKK